MENLNSTISSLASASIQSSVGVEALGAVRGDRKGDAATVARSQSDLTDIQEEIGNSVGKLADRRSLGQSKLRQGTGLGSAALRRISAYYERLPDAPREAKLLDLVKRLQAFEEFLERQDGKASFGAESVLEALRAVDGSERVQYMLLQGARLHFERSEGSGQLVSLLDQAENSFIESGVAYDVRADFAVLVHAGSVASGNVTPQDLRDKYREMLTSGMNLGQMFYALSDLYKRLNFKVVTGLFLKAAGDDLSTTSSDADRSFLGGLLKELGVLKALRTEYEACNRLVERMERMFPGYAGGLGEDAPEKLMGTLLTFCAKPVPNIEDGKKAAKPFDGKGWSSAADVVLCNGIIELHKAMPDCAFPQKAVNSARVQQDVILLEVSSDLVEIDERSYEDRQGWE